ncbi:hypothetical protein [Pseudomonas fluorescens]|nr:hypothetical protein [Pseudomonas fluorescens]
MNFQRSARFLMSQGEVICLSHPMGYTIKTIIGRLQVIQEEVIGNLILSAGQVSTVDTSSALTLKAMSHTFVSVTHSNYASLPDMWPGLRLQECKA